MKALLALGSMIALLAMVAAPRVSEAGSATEINAAANATLQSFVDQNSSARELGHKAAGVLVFPSIVKAGLGFGGGPHR